MVVFQNKDGVSFALKLNGSKLKGREIRVMNCSKGDKMKDSNKQKSISFLLNIETWCFATFYVAVKVSNS